MSFAFRNDGTPGWRAVDSIDELFPNESYTSTQPLNTFSMHLTVEELSVQTMGQRDKLLVVAASRMGPLQDAIDTESANEEEIEILLKWKRYRIALNRIDKQEKFPFDVEWPRSPDEDVVFS